jgi:RPA family protein
VRARIQDLLRSEFARSESDFEPNYVLTPIKRKIHRVKIVGTVMSDPIFGTDNTYARFQLDDATGEIWVSGFHSRVAMIERLRQGDLVQLVGTVNEYRGNLELVAECVLQTEPNYWLLHRAEVARGEIEARKEYERAKSIMAHERNVLEAKETAREIGLDTQIVESLNGEIGEEEEDLAGEVLELISKLDDGGGVPVKDVIEAIKGSHSSDEVEAQLIKLMEEGEIYEPTVGKYAKI